MCVDNACTRYVTLSLASTQAVFFMESMMEHVAKELKMTPEEVRKVNLYKNGQVCLQRVQSLIRVVILLSEIFEALQTDGISQL